MKVYYVGFKNRFQVNENFSRFSDSISGWEIRTRWFFLVKGWRNY